MAKTTKTTLTSPTKTAKTISGLKAPIYNLKAEKVGDFALSKSIFDVKIDNDLIASSVRTYLANQRSAHAKVKERGDVAGTTKKMYAQKGTGRARHSTAKAGIFVGGGSVHGPQGNQNYSLKVNKKSKKLALHSLLSKFAKEQKIIVIDDFKDLTPKTKSAWSFIDLLEKSNQTLANSKKIGIITGEAAPNVIRAFRNIPGFSLLSLNSINVHDVSNQNILIFSQKAIESLK